jgi:hypothetical protein
MYLKRNCQNRERQQSIQDVARPRNRKGVIDRRLCSGVSREGANKPQQHSTRERLSQDRRALNLAMYLKLNCQNRERRQSIQDVARPRNSRGVINIRGRSNVSKRRVQNGLKRVATKMEIGEMQQQQKTNGRVWGCSMQRTRQGL